MAAEFKIGRLRFTWNGAWAPATFYNRDAVVNYQGKTYVCITPNTSAANFYTDYNANYWNLVIDGKQWVGVWQPSTLYSLGNTVVYGGAVYYCTTAHTSGSTSITLANWTLYSQGIKFNTAWQTSKAYGVGDIVVYGGIVYYCITPHVSTFSTSIGLENDIANWTVYDSGISFKGTWSSGVRYKQNDVVVQGANVYSCTTYHTSTSTFDVIKWTLYIPGQEYMGTWSSGIFYQLDDLVSYGGNTYISLQANNLNYNPAVSASNWTLIKGSYELTGDWSTITTYKISDVVRRNGSVFVAVSDNTAQDPVSSTTTKTYTATGSSGTTLKLGSGGTGTGTSGLVVGMTITGFGFTRGQSIVSITDSTTAIISAAPDGLPTDGQTLSFVGLNSLYWTLLIPSTAWQNFWIASKTYQPGDLVVWQNATYRCVAQHSSTNLNRPDLDITNTNWIYYILHARKNALNTYGDIETYTTGPGYAAVPIGTQSYPLRSTNKVPAWQNINVVPNVYYVAPTGTDDPGYGTTWDKPWKTIAYACSFVGAGLYYQNTYSLIVLNKNWAIAEMYNWMLYQKTNSISPFSPSSVFDAVKTPRDARYVVDAVLYDIARGGNSQTVAAALSYFAYGSSNTFFNSAVAAEMPYFIAALTYLNTLIDYCISGTYSGVSYQTLNGVASPITFTATVQSGGSNAETGSQAYVDSLFSIIIAALTTQSTTLVPAQNTGLTASIFIKTGTYQESLPITVPENVALIGDELRGVVVQPKIIINTVAYNTSSVTNKITVSSTANLANAMPIQFGASFGSLTYGQTYYVIGSSITSNQFSVSLQAGSLTAVNLITTTSQFVTVYGGDALKNMFLVRNGTGLRNMTLSGLLGFLGPLNEFLTQRPTGSAYVALDPGTGTTDSRAWIFRRSPYIQNVTTFGTGCIGMKVDGTLHDGGYKSMTANDFTHILSDGIGAWITGPDSKAELISVFTYYNYTGYMAENGGRIRAANGNSSYGIYGVIAEGFDSTETPITGIVFNQSTQVQASVQSSFGTNAQLLRLQFANAGSGYNTQTTNMLQYSNSFITSPWTSDGNVTFTQTQAAPTGFSEAWTMTGTSTSNTGYVYQNVTILPAGFAYTNLSGYNGSGSGAGAQFNVTVTSTAYTVVVSNAGGSGYVVNNQIIISGNQLGGANGVNDCILTVSGLSGSAITTVTVTGAVPTGSANPYVVSIYAQQGSATSFDIQGIFSGSSSVTSGISYNFTTNTIAPYGSGGGFTPVIYGATVLPNGWYRIYFVTNDTTGLNNNLQVRLYPKGTSGTANTYNYFYGSQVQIATSPSFYLETTTNQFTSYANYEVTGSGTGAVVVGDELRSNSIFQSRISADSTGVTGGANYLTASNNAQGGTSQYIILAPQDTALASNYIGMRLFINSGTGAGQYGYIGTYTPGTKVAQILKESFSTLNINATTASGNVLTLSSGNTTTLYVGLPVQFIPTYYTTVVTSVSQATTSVTATIGGQTNTLTVSSTAKLAVNMGVTFSGAQMFGNITAGITYYIIQIVDSVTIQISSSLSGSAWGLITATAGGTTPAMTMTFTANNGYLFASSTTSNGTANMVPNYPVQFTGSAIGGVTAGTTYYINDIIDTQNFTVSTNLVTISATATSSSNNAITVTSGTASNLTPLNPILFTNTVMGGIVDNQKYFISKIVDSSNFQITASILTLNAISTTAVSNLITTSSTSGFVVNNPIIFTGTTTGNIQAETIYYILAINDATTFTISGTPGGTTVNLTTSACNVILRTAPVAATLTTASGTMVGTSTNQKYLATSSSGSMNATFSTFLFGGIATGQLYYINTVIDSTTFTVTTTQYSGTPATLTTKSGSMNVAAVGFDHVIPGTVAASALDYTTIYYIEPRTTISSPPFAQINNASGAVSLTSGTFWQDIAWGNKYFMAIPSGNATGAISQDGSSWSSITMPATAAWTGVAYGNGYWIIVASASNTVARSLSNGQGWRTTTLPINANWVNIVYGNGRFVTMTSDTALVSYSTNYGGTWSLTTLPSDKTVTVASGAKLSTAQQKFGVASLALNGTSDYIALPASTDFTFGTGDFCIEMWIYRTGNAGVNQLLVDFRPTGSASVSPTIYLNTSYVPVFLVNGSVVITGSAPVALSTWTHIALAKSSGTTTLYVNGAVSGTAYTDSNSYIQGPCTIGANTIGAAWFGGYIDEVRISKGASRYASPFTTALVPFTTDTNTVLLMHFEGANNSTAISTTVGTWTKMAYGAGRYVAIQSGDARAAYSLNGVTWLQSTLPSSSAWSSIAFGNGRFVAVSSSSSANAAYSFDGITWYSSSQPVQATSVTYGQGIFVALNTSNALAYTSESGLDWLQRTVLASAYNATSFGFNSSNIGVFTTLGGTGTSTNISAGATAKGRAVVSSGVISTVSEFETGSNYTVNPTIAFTDPNVTTLAVVTPRISNGVLGNPTLANKGTGYSTNTTVITINGSGYADQYQTGLTIILNNLTRLPTLGDNLTISGVSQSYKVTSAAAIFGTVAPNIEANVTISPAMSNANSPANNTPVTIRTKYSQARLTNHDFLLIGEGNFASTNYPGTSALLPAQNSQTVETNYGRVFYTSTDQDGNFKVGNLFGVQQATGIVTLSASQFGLSGLTSLKLGGIAVGGSSTIVTQFSTDPTFAANSDAVIPTQKAIKSYLTSRLSTGGSNTITNQLTAGTVIVGGTNRIQSTLPNGSVGSTITIPPTVRIQSVDGNEAAWLFFVKSWNRR